MDTSYQVYVMYEIQDSEFLYHVYDPSLKFVFPH